MRHTSLKRRRLNDSVKEYRQSLREMVGRCEVCLRPAAPEWLDVHELVPGSSRAKALDKEFALLCVHRLCHDYLETLTIPNQLAYLYIARASSFDLEKYHALIGRCWPSWDEVSGYVSKILGSR